MSDDPKTLVSTQWLAQHMKDPDLRILDATWHMPDQDRDAKAEYNDAHIPGARFFDIDDVSDARSDTAGKYAGAPSAWRIACTTTSRAWV